MNTLAGALDDFLWAVQKFFCRHRPAFCGTKILCVECGKELGVIWFMDRP